MGIQGLLPLLKSIQKPTHLRNFAGQTLGVDAYGWLHRGTVSCAIELAQQKPTRKHIDFALSRVRMLIHFGIKPYLVFDGAYLPSKAHTEKERAARRKESKELGLELLNMKRVSQAYLELQKAIDVTPLMARELIEELKLLDVPYVVAPFEADSQLAYLEKQNIISGVVSEDSDLLVFGVNCLITKLDQYGECVTVNRSDFTACREVSLVGWTDNEFRMMAMLSGCDYLPGIDKMGLKTAYRLVRKHKTLDRVIRAVQFDGKMKVPPGYLEAFNAAERTFLHQWVFCSEAQGLVHLNELPAELQHDSMPYIGQPDSSEIAIGVAKGDLDPNTKERIVFSAIPRHSFTHQQRPAQTPDEKPGKPISEYFKSIRTPLAELDPNSFTPSPSQQNLLRTQQGLTWSASGTESSRPPLLARARSAYTPSSAPQTTKRTISDQWSAGRTSPKRRRLCSESGTMSAAAPPKTSQIMTSRFFSQQNTNPVASMRRRKSDDFELWSDDSVADAIVEVTATQESNSTQATQSPRKRKKLEVFADPVSELAAEPTTTRHYTAQLSHESDMGPDSRSLPDEDPPEAPVTSFEEDNNIFSKGIASDLASLKAKYAYQPGSPRSSLARSKSMPDVPRTPLQETRANNAARMLATREPPVWPLAAAAVKGPVQGLTHDAKARHVAVPNSSPPAVDALGPEDGNVERQCADPGEPHHGPELEVQGSEDCLIPCSPESSGDDRVRLPKLNIAHFAFAP